MTVLTALGMWASVIKARIHVVKPGGLQAALDVVGPLQSDFPFPQRRLFVETFHVQEEEPI